MAVYPDGRNLGFRYDHESGEYAYADVAGLTDIARAPSDGKRRSSRPPWDGRTRFLPHPLSSSRHRAGPMGCRGHSLHLAV